MQHRLMLNSEEKARELVAGSWEGSEAQAERRISWPEGAGLPVLTQPGLGVTTTTTVTTITQTGGDWRTGLFDVCDDVGVSVVAVALPCCLEVSLAHQFGESLCLPLLPASTLAMRVAIRERFKIRGSVCDDWVMIFCCYPLAVCQMMREMKRRLMRRTYTVTTTLQSS